MPIIKIPQKIHHLKNPIDLSELQGHHETIIPEHFKAKMNNWRISLTDSTKTVSESGVAGALPKKGEGCSLSMGRLPRACMVKN